MISYKQELLKNICYSDLVYGRINKKLDLAFSNQEIENLIYIILSETDEAAFQKKGKNIYVTNNERNIRLTINSFTNRIITADRLNKKISKSEASAYKETFDTWDRVAKRYQDLFMSLNIYDETYDFICSSLNKVNSKILEIGCGPGNITKYILSKRPDLDIFGIDTSPNMIELAEKNNPTASFAIMDCRKIDIIKSKFDGIVCGFCLPYLSEIEVHKLIADCYYLLNENGLIYLSFVEGQPSKSGFQTGYSGDRVFFYFHHLQDLETKLIENKFSELNLSKVKYQKSETETEIHTIITAIKN